MRLHHRLFQLFIFLLPTQLGLHLWPLWAFVSGIRVDYLSPTIYLTDVVFMLLVLVWVWEEQVRFRKKKVLFLFLVLVLTNVVFAQQPVLSFYKWFKVLEFGTLSLYVFANKENLLKLTRTPLALAIIYTGFMAIAQIALQRTLGGVFYLLGERNFSVSMPGIALINFMGRAIMRPYATFGHPNALAGFLLIAVFMLIAQKTRSLLNWIAIGLGFVVIVLTFSQNAWIGVFLMVLFFILQRKKEWGRIKKISFFVILVLALLSPIISQVLAGDKMVMFWDLSIKRRLLLSEIAGVLFAKYPIFGVGLGGFIPAMVGVLRTHNFLITETVWWLQPVHNIYLLVLSETGIVGFGVFAFFVWQVLIKTKSRLDIGLILILVTGFLDHYWLTLQQNFLCFAILVGFLIERDLLKYKN